MQKNKRMHIKPTVNYRSQQNQENCPGNVTSIFDVPDDDELYLWYGLPTKGV